MGTLISWSTFDKRFSGGYLITPVLIINYRHEYIRIQQKAGTGGSLFAPVIKPVNALVGAQHAAPDWAVMPHPCDLCFIAGAVTS